MLLNLHKRRLLLQTLPKTGSISDQLLAKGIIKKLVHVSDEHKAKIDYIDLGNDMFKYEPTKDEPMEFEWSEAEIHVLKRGVEAMDKEESVTLDLVDLCSEVKEL